MPTQPVPLEPQSLLLRSESVGQAVRKRAVQRRVRLLQHSTAGLGRERRKQVTSDSDTREPILGDRRQMV